MTILCRRIIQQIINFMDKYSSSSCITGQSLPYLSKISSEIQFHRKKLANAYLFYRCIEFEIDPLISGVIHSSTPLSHVQSMTLLLNIFRICMNNTVESAAAIL